MKDDHQQIEHISEEEEDDDEDLYKNKKRGNSKSGVNGNLGKVL